MAGRLASSADALSTRMDNHLTTQWKRVKTVLWRLTAESPSMKIKNDVNCPGLGRP